MKKSIVFLAMCLTAVPAVAQTAAEAKWYTKLQAMDSNQVMLLLMMGVVLLIIILLLILMLYLMSFMSTVLRKENPSLADGPSWWERFKESYITGQVDEVGGKEEQAKLMSNHSYDGITELDNFMPPWLQWVFVGTVVVAVIYFVHYSVLGNGATGVEEYQEELRVEAVAAEIRKANQAAGIDENTVVFDESAAAIGSGKTIFETNCVACHATDGGGGVGPNLTDEYWLHGGSIKNVFTVVKFGVIEKGMIPWQDQLSPEEMQQVASYILSLKGTTPANPKAPQGEPYSAAPAGADSTPDSTGVAAPDSTVVVASI